MANISGKFGSEKPGVNNHRAKSSPNFDSLLSTPFSNDSSAQGGPVITTSRQPPPVPSRQTSYQPSSLAPYSGYNGYSYPYNPGFGGLYGAYGGYGGYHNRMGDDVVGGGFAQQAEMSTRQAFQSVETIVRAFGSIAMMLDSTYQAVFNSFRAVIGMADQLSRVRHHLSHIYSTLAFFKVLRWLVKKIKFLLRWLKFRNRRAASDEQLWEECIRGDGVENVTVDGANSGNPTWPILLFFAIVMGGPWILWNFFNSFGGKNEKKPDWLTGLIDSYIGMAEFDFQARNTDELSFKRGTKIIIAPKDIQQQTSLKDWLLASIDGDRTGLVPINYIKIIGRNRGRKTSNYNLTNQMVKTASINTNNNNNIADNSTTTATANNSNSVVNNINNNVKLNIDNKISEEEENYLNINERNFQSDENSNEDTCKEESPCLKQQPIDANRVTEVGLNRPIIDKTDLGQDGGLAGNRSPLIINKITSLNNSNSKNNNNYNDNDSNVSDNNNNNNNDNDNDKFNNNSNNDDDDICN